MTIFKIEKCDCQCHKKGFESTRHPQPCCFKCDICGELIKREHLYTHGEHCRSDNEVGKEGDMPY